MADELEVVAYPECLDTALPPLACLIPAESKEADGDADRMQIPSGSGRTIIGSQMSEGRLKATGLQPKVRQQLSLGWHLELLRSFRPSRHQPVTHHSCSFSCSPAAASPLGALQGDIEMEDLRQSFRQLLRQKTNPRDVSRGR